jgi:glucose/arabinose dehydrogenase
MFLIFLACTKATPETSGPQDTQEQDSAVLPLECQLVESGWGPDGETALKVEVVVSDLATPWAMDWLPDGRMLLTERDGRLSIVDQGTLHVLAQVPVTERGEGGLLGLALHPDFEGTRAFFLYATVDDVGTENQVQQWVLAEDSLSASFDRLIFPDIPARQYHNGGRLRIGPDDKLYVGTGDAGEPDNSQDTSSPAGKVLRLELDGSIPDDNPFPGSATWVYGVRNTQGFDWREDGSMLISDHGPSGLGNEGGRSGHDEITLASAGDNLGWPEVYACEEGEGFVPASITFSDAMPPGGAAIYRGSELEDWQGDFIVGVLGFQTAARHLHRLRIGPGGNVLLSEVYLSEEYGRLREVTMGPDGGLYVSTSNCDGRGDCGEGDLILRIGAQ